MTKTVGNSAMLRWFYFFKIATRRELKYLVAVGIHIAFLYLKKTFRCSILHGGKKAVSFISFHKSFILEKDTVWILLNPEGSPSTCVSPGCPLSCSLDHSVFESKVKLIVSIGKPKTLLSLCTLKRDVQQTGMECGHMYSSKE